MDKIRVRRIAPPERRILHRMKRQLRNQVNCRHARIILLSSGKVSNREIAQRVDCTPQWVRKVVHRFNADGIEAVTWYPYFHATATPRQFTADLVEEIARVAVSPPRALIGMNQWSVSKLRQYLIEQKIIGSISLEWLRILLRRSGIRWRRTKTWKASTDPEFSQKTFNRDTDNAWQGRARKSSGCQLPTAATKEYGTFLPHTTWKPIVCSASSPRTRPPSTF